MIYWKEQFKGRKAVGGHNFVTSGWVSEQRMKQVAAVSGIIMTQYGLRAREERSCTDGSKSWFPPAMKELEVRPVARNGLIVIGDEEVAHRHCNKRNLCTAALTATSFSAY
ncbi:hypothetical protein HPB52_015083 [Rhipicephalus sanguineus]|uniref:Uncharacterized protein n=1 Tax=Rhipicephalus sanguineus TaxID=34632 RepID=A0A9D4PZ69_RHISA|nr:hypothetical protein HPB52_015083 [Rhipicephalus sanguineus]